MIRVRDLDFSYDGKHSVLNIKELEILEGEKIFLYGPSGTGKSTLLNLLSGVITPNRGVVEFNQASFSTLRARQRDRIRGSEMGYIFQRFNLINYLSVRENILLPLKLAKKYTLGKRDFDKRLLELASDLGISSLLDRKVDKLSVGQQQRVAVCRALLGKPKLIIADEPTSSLDEDMTESFMELLLKEWELEKFTLIFVSHDKRLEKFFDRSLNLEVLNGERSL